MNLEEVRTHRKTLMRTIRSHINASVTPLPAFEKGVLQGQLVVKLRELANELEQDVVHAWTKEMY